jgi:hypothetical protein
VSVTGQDENREDPLLSAISEFRQELIRWIDSQVGLIRQRDSQSESSTAGPAALTPLQVRSAPRQEADAPTPAAARMLNPEPKPVAPAAEVQTSGDARDRLEALARQLGERLRLSEGGRRGPEKEHKDATEDRRAPAR